MYKYLKSEAKGILGSKKIKWNFTKFLVNQKGDVLKRYAPTAKPEDIQKDLNKTKTYIKPNHVAGVKKDEAGDVVEIILDANFSSTYQPNQIYYDAQTGNLFKNIGKQGEAPRFIKVEY